MKLSIIIINYKTPKLTRQCIESIYKTVNNIDFEIIVVDNHSQDDSEQIIMEAFPNIVWINNKENEGFGRANNLGVKKSKGEYVLFLNSDVIVLENAIEQSLEYLKQHEDIGILGCKLLNKDGSLQKSTYSYIADYVGILEKNIFLDWIFQFSKKTKTIKCIMGAFMLMRKDVFDEIGGFDPDFFLYAEEMELCYRLQKKGYKVMYSNDVSAIHIHGASSFNKDKPIQQNLLSNSLLFYKIKGIGGYIIYHFLFILNLILNFILMWKFDSRYREYYYALNRNYLKNIYHYFKIPFIFTRKIGNGKRILKI